jgi:hypothetical protein
MGEAMSVPSVLGPKSVKNISIKTANPLDPKNARTTKNELYQLYSQGKIIHIEKYNELEEQLNKLLILSKEYIKEIKDYKIKIEDLENKISKMERNKQKNESSEKENNNQSTVNKDEKSLESEIDKTIFHKMD